MQLESFSRLFGASSLFEALDAVRAHGFSSVELAASPEGDPAYLDADRLLSDAGERLRLLDAVGERGLGIVSLVRTGNPLHPVPRSRRLCRSAGERTIRLAAALGVDTVVLSAGRPGRHDGARHANWVTGTFPPDYEAVVRRQWEDVAVPFWRERARFAADSGVRIAVEMHPGSFVYDADGLMRLRAEAGASLGGSIDPDRLFRQGFDPVAVARRLAVAVFHVALGAARRRIARRCPALASALEKIGFRGPVTQDVERPFAPGNEAAVRGAGTVAALRDDQFSESL
jgi:sugar phosphate isomerase/epimerase